MVRTLALAGLLAAGLSVAAPNVTMSGVSITGTTKSGGEEFFGGIPYAKPPVGDLRFRPPVPFDWSGRTSFSATNFGNRCLQGASASGTSEDCLTANVYRPTGTTANAKLPVLVWMHGGFFMSSSSQLFDPNAIIPISVSRGTPIVFVSFNSRVNALGYPTGPEAVAAKALNLGLQDQIALYQWVQDNIASFGGDPTKVTIGGESCGAASTAFHIFNPQAAKLFRAGIIQSGGAALLPALNATYLPNSFRSFASSAGCSSGDLFDCLRKASTSNIQRAVAAIRASPGGIYGPFGPVSDGVFVPSREDIFHGDFEPRPFIDGTVLDEGTYFAPKGTNTEAQILADLPNWTKVDPKRLLALYPDKNPDYASPYGSGVGSGTGQNGPEFKRESSILGDIIMLAPARQFLSRATAKGTKVFGYLFSDTGGANFLGPGISHGADLPFLFPTGFGTGARGGTSGTTANLLIEYFVSFVATLDPNDGKGRSRANWPAYNTTNPMVIQLKGGSASALADTYRKEQTDFINSQV